MAQGATLTGTWRLVRWFNETADGTRYYPLGEDCTGFISYTPDGHVFVQISAPDRAGFAGTDPFGGTADEARGAAASHISYAGRFAHEGAEVRHFVEHCSFPNWVGTVQRRRVEWTETGLRLSAAGVVFNGRKATAILDWERA